jgi:hypothetical protein
MTRPELASRYYCSLRDKPGQLSGLHAAGNGKPRSKTCTYCRGQLVTETGLWGVFEWRGDGRYRREAAENTFTRELAAEDWRLDHTGAGTSLVVRWIPVDAWTEAAAAAIAEAVRTEHDFGGWLAMVLSTVAAGLGSSDALTAGRPGSWEAALVDQLVKGTVGYGDESLAHDRPGAS